MLKIKKETANIREYKVGNNANIVNFFAFVKNPNVLLDCRQGQAVFVTRDRLFFWKVNVLILRVVNDHSEQKYSDSSYNISLFIIHQVILRKVNALRNLLQRTWANIHNCSETSLTFRYFFVNEYIKNVVERTLRRECAKSSCRFCANFDYGRGGHGPCPFDR